jgi:diaminohydroxyphosphoribosylaminopyrimidine deaminase/5-amino-6-(5-phosphoribosylamino)uracil reductase
VREGIARVVVGTRDPNPRVDGRGLDILRTAGVEVVVAGGEVAAACAALIAPFSTAITRGRVHVVLKTATSLDGRVATRTGASRFITGAASRHLVHRLRDAVDAVIVGASTVVADDPALTVRDVVREDGIAVRDPRRVILDRRASLPLTARVFDPPGGLLVHDVHITPGPMSGVECIAVAGVDISAIVATLQRRGLTSVMVEAGPRLAAAFLSAGVVDELWWFQAPVIIGGDGAPAIAPLGVEALMDAPRMHPVHRAALDEDALVILRPA